MAPKLNGAAQRQALRCYGASNAPSLAFVGLSFAATFAAPASPLWLRRLYGPEVSPKLNGAAQRQALRCCGVTIASAGFCGFELRRFFCGSSFASVAQQALGARSGAETERRRSAPSASLLRRDYRLRWLYVFQLRPLLLRAPLPRHSGSDLILWCCFLHEVEVALSCSLILRSSVMPVVLAR